MTRPVPRPFDLTAALPQGRTVIEASAGTGKTYSLTGLIVRFIVEKGVPVDQLLMVTFTRAAANELRDRARQALLTAADVVASGHVPPGQAWMSVLLDPADEQLTRTRRIVEALARLDEIAITTIHGFCQQSLLQLGLRAGARTDAVLVESTNDLIAEIVRDLTITELADDPTRLASPGSSDPRISTAKQAESELKVNVAAVLANPGAAFDPDPASDHHARRWIQLTRRACDEVALRQIARGEIGYDALVSGLHRALTDPVNGDAVATQLTQRYSVVLIDEFQDTDRHQWEIFQRAFGKGTLITVGDPKQSIYRFRGADVHAYLDAVDEAPACSLAVNFRSDRAVLDGLDTLFTGATMGDDRIAFTRVTARSDAVVNALGDGPGLALRMVPHHPSLMDSKGKFLIMAHVRSLVLADVVATIVDLLDHGVVTDERHPDADHRRVDPRDIAVLVPSHADADNVAEALRRARVPAVRTRTGSVLNTVAAEQWRILLSALAQPHHAPSVRAGALGWFFATDVATLVEDENTIALLQEQCAAMADRMRSAGLAAFYDEQKAATNGLLCNVLQRDGGERHITDCDHVAELLAAALHGASSEPGHVLHVLDGLIAASDDRSEGAMRRIDSDSHAVQITTIHSAKGLEFPIVLAPFSFKARGNVRRPYSYIGRNGRRTLDLASTVGWDAGPVVPGDETTRFNQEARRNLTIADSDGDELRLLYVALTRAQHRCIVWWASGHRAMTSSLARILLDREGAGPVRNTPVGQRPKTGKNSTGFVTTKPAYQDLSLDDIARQVRALAAASAGTIGLRELPPSIDNVVWGGRGSDPHETLDQARGGSRRRVDEPTWRRWSFSRLGATVETIAESVRPPDLGDLRSDTELAVPDGAGNDEPASPDDEVAVSPAATAGPGQLSLGLGPTAHLAGIAGGTRFGTFVHAVLQHVDFTSPDLATDIRLLATHQARRDGLEIPIDDVVAGLVAAIHTPLGGASVFGGLALADISPADRLAELDFDFAIAQRFPCGLIGEAMLATLALDDPMRPFAMRLAGEFAHLDISGWMGGSIDAVVRLGRGSDTRFVVIDYKTNRLHPPDTLDPVAAYQPTALTPAMEHSRYPLQALLYSVALHRYLGWRLAATYSPDRHLGGIGYLFVRGMVGPNTPMFGGVASGVFSWRPPAATVLEIDRLFLTGGSR